MNNTFRRKCQEQFRAETDRIPNALLKKCCDLSCAERKNVNWAVKREVDRGSK